jgi:hypothetical protein
MCCLSFSIYDFWLPLCYLFLWSGSEKTDSSCLWWKLFCGMKINKKQTLHRKLKIEQHEPHSKPWVNSCAPGRVSSSGSTSCYSCWKLALLSRHNWHLLQFLDTFLIVWHYDPFALQIMVYLRLILFYTQVYTNENGCIKRRLVKSSVRKRTCVIAFDQ